MIWRMNELYASVERERKPLPSCINKSFLESMEEGGVGKSIDSQDRTQELRGRDDDT